MKNTGFIDEQSHGVFIISTTPFSNDGSIDFVSVDSLVEFYIDKRVTGMTILGMMGEANKLSANESENFVKHVIKRVNNQVPVVVGVSDAGLQNLIRLSQFSMDSGCAGVMVAPISGLNTEKKLYGYFTQVFDALGQEVPVCYQDYPQSTGVHISVECFNRLVKDFPQLVMLKHEDCPGLCKLTQVRDTAKSQNLRRVSILTGNGGLYLPQELARGADGAMTGFAYPEMLVEVVSLHAEGKAEHAEDLFDAYLPMVRYEQQPGFGLAVRKEVLRQRGAIACALTRSPGPRLSQSDQKELSKLIARLERRLNEMGRQTKN
ncbi:MAG: dihydrodipicolinate synthase family protein [SAR324 cluster bacterium]|jgi:4-hydroxy-tetrahydrodipicolinate synthase|nr:dihydrodipicolinate synthase family protein [SAR324 cluster bacterium]|tara:strand:- start:248 stop:1204 length:957 start_codon:yes stop_codon:yes gene_type:complete